MIVAKNKNGDTLEIIKQYKNMNSFIYRFQLTYANESPFFTGEQYNTKELILNDAASVALSKLCGCFTVSDIVAGIKNNDKLQITGQQKTALHLAFIVLSNGGDMSKNAAFYIKQLIERA
jgi:uncharacterized protein YegP (UPF0339 family)